MVPSKTFFLMIALFVASTIVMNGVGIAALFAKTRRLSFGSKAPSSTRLAVAAGPVDIGVPEIAVLLRNRDKTVQEWQWRWRRRGHVFEDTRLEVASSFDIDLEARLALVEQAEREPSALAAVSARARLPRMAEGWGA